MAAVTVDKNNFSPFLPIEESVPLTTITSKKKTLAWNLQDILR